MAPTLGSLCMWRHGSGWGSRQAVYVIPPKQIAPTQSRCRTISTKWLVKMPNGDTWTNTNDHGIFVTAQSSNLATRV